MDYVDFGQTGWQTPLTEARPWPATIAGGRPAPGPLHAGRGSATLLGTGRIPFPGLALPAGFNFLPAARTAFLHTVNREKRLSLKPLNPMPAKVESPYND
jgi:hypothetical protein